MSRVSGLRRYVIIVAVLLLINWLVAAALLEQETLDQDAAYRAAGLEPPTRPTPIPVAA